MDTGNFVLRAEELKEHNHLLAWMFLYSTFSPHWDIYVLFTYEEVQNIYYEITLTQFCESFVMVILTHDISVHIEVHLLNLLW